MLNMHWLLERTKRDNKYSTHFLTHSLIQRGHKENAQLQLA